ncbi:ABC transporter ATP-binding protein [Bradyrhizobium sp. HKCCYLS2038]|uniref:ABC transporter ATP-binding protein n=1 Tax=unclassified Bradyrhizobium TaxID=2631580 RepID=UPI003EC13962
MASVSLRKLEKSYGSQIVVHGIDLEIADGEFIVLVGPSGCGKSTTLRMIAGLEPISAGEVRIDDEVMNRLPPRARDVAMVFQDYALYPHKTVRENLAFTLRVRGVAAEDARNRIEGVAELLGLSEVLERRPAQLSGGQRQRVAMGRALVRRPRVFLFDEPLSNLDAQLRAEVRTEIKRLHQQIRTTIVYVTHDQVEAMTLADRIVIMRGGVIEQIGTPDEIYNRPRNAFVAGFIGSPPMNFVTVRIENGSLTFGNGAALPLAALPLASAQALEGRTLLFGVRPEHLGLPGAPFALPVDVQVVEPLGSDTLVHCDIGGQRLTARLVPDMRPGSGERFNIGIDPLKVYLFDADSGQIIN